MCLNVKDDIVKMSNPVDQARNKSQKIDEILQQKLLILNHNKSKYILLGNRKAKHRKRNEPRNIPWKFVKKHWKTR